MDLSDNMLADIAGSAFSELRQLEQLYLKRNTRQELKFPVDAFQETTSLKILDLHHVYALSSAYDFERLIGNLTKLHTLIISISQGNWRGVFDTISSKLVQLKELHMHCINIQLGNYTFHSFRNSRIMKLVMRCFAESQDVSRYSFFQHVEMLDLGYTRYSSPNNISRFWPGLARTNISNLLLAHIFVKPTKLEESFYSGLQETHVKWLILDNNCIVSLGEYLWLV